MIKNYELIENGINYYKLEIGNNKFIITNSPSDRNLSDYVKKLKYEETNIIVRLGERRYNEELIRGIDFIDLYIEDGSIPNEDTINIFLNIVRKNRTIAIHCISGLGRAPMMVVIAMIIIYKKKELDSIISVRQMIPNSLNTKQINFLKNDLRKIRDKNCFRCRETCIIM